MKCSTVAMAFALMITTGCGSSSDKSVPTLALTFRSPSHYSLDDFALGEDVLYWELRTRQGSNPPSPTAWTYDPPSREALSEEQKALLESTDSNFGLQPGCQIDDCVLFGAAVTQEGIQVLSSNAELLAFFAPINSEAKLHLWLWANDYQGHTYEAVESGYNAVVHVADPLCIEDHYYQVFVDTNGVITETEMLMTRTPEVCP